MVPLQHSVSNRHSLPLPVNCAPPYRPSCWFGLRRHRSNPNLTGNPRWALVTCYCALDNPPVAPSTAPRVEILQLGPPDILAVGQRHMAKIESESSVSGSARL